MASFKSRLFLTLLCPLLLGPLAGAAAEETQTVDAFATWTLKGVAVPSAPDQVTMVASLHGPVFVDAGVGPMFAGMVTCPGTLTVNTVDGSQQGQGVCAFTAKDGAEAYGSWECSGYHLVGCKGSFTFTGGKGRLEGVAGGSELLIRGDLPKGKPDAAAPASDEIVGIMVWHNLTGTLPGQQ